MASPPTELNKSWGSGFGDVHVGGVLLGPGHLDPELGRAGQGLLVAAGGIGSLLDLIGRGLVALGGEECPVALASAAA